MGKLQQWLTGGQRAGEHACLWHAREGGARTGK